jgi:predicted lipoprotein with Yx(FWY)xxD motif
MAAQGQLDHGRVREVVPLRTGWRKLLEKGTLATVVLGGAAVGASTVALCGPASAKGTASSKSLVIKTQHVASIGTVLTSSSGRTLYLYTLDPAGKVACTGACAKAWPPLLLPKGVTRIKAPHGVKGLSVVHVAAGRLQVFFHHAALYSFVSDTKKGQASGQGVENDWYAVLSNGKSSAPAAASTAPSTGAPATTPTTSSGSSGTGSTSPSTTPSTSPPVSKSPVVTVPAPSAPTTTTPTTRPATTTTTSRPATTTTTAPPAGGAGF